MFYLAGRLSWEWINKANVLLFTFRFIVLHFKMALLYSVMSVRLCMQRKVLVVCLLPVILLFLSCACLLHVTGDDKVFPVLKSHAAQAALLLLTL